MAIKDIGNDSSRPYGLGGGGVGNCFQTLQMKVNYADVAAVTTHSLLDLPAGAAITRCYFIIKTAFTSGGSATAQIQESTGSNVSLLSSTDMAVAAMTAGTVFVAPSGDGSDVLSNVITHADNYDTSARTIDWVTGTATFTAGEGILVVEFIENVQ